MSEENTGGDGPNGAVLNDPVDVIIDKLLRYDSVDAVLLCSSSSCILMPCLSSMESCISPRKTLQSQFDMF